MAAKSSTSEMCLYFLAIFLPPIAMCFRLGRGIGACDILINILLCILAKPAEDIPPLADGESDPLVILEHAHEWLSRLDVKLIANKFVGKAVKARLSVLKEQKEELEQQLKRLEHEYCDAIEPLLEHELLLCIGNELDEKRLHHSAVAELGRHLILTLQRGDHKSRRNEAAHPDGAEHITSNDEALHRLDQLISPHKGLGHATRRKAELLDKRTKGWTEAYERFMRSPKGLAHAYLLRNGREINTQNGLPGHMRVSHIPWRPEHWDPDTGRPRAGHEHMALSNMKSESLMVPQASRRRADSGASSIASDRTGSSIGGHSQSAELLTDDEEATDTPSENEPDSHMTQHRAFDPQDRQIYVPPGARRQSAASQASDSSTSRGRRDHRGRGRGRGRGR
ncbi:hypothetical protein Rhopal_006222-T1 [Rhodotorula paludigena]|uniref:Uncharacterized protein n=1 Tax=Rhodotorula paludigena TaxID=86838 RepID=A0AAV5GTD8_9BASI|nr:hypothetical protein Rhopal_006222-T1 [Rhodotorula paludigena]